jgi:hypothetical protein
MHAWILSLGNNAVGMKCEIESEYTIYFVEHVKLLMETKYSNKIFKKTYVLTPKQDDSQSVLF